MRHTVHVQLLHAMEELLTRFTFSIVLCSRLYWFLIEFAPLCCIIVTVTFLVCLLIAECLLFCSRGILIINYWRRHNILFVLGRASAVSTWVWCGYQPTTYSTSRVPSSLHQIPHPLPLVAAPHFHAGSPFPLVQGLWIQQAGRLVWICQNSCYNWPLPIPLISCGCKMPRRYCIPSCEGLELLLHAFCQTLCPMYSNL